MKSPFENYSKFIGLVMLALVIAMLLSTPSTIFVRSITVIDTELSHVSEDAVPVRTKLDFGNNEHIRAFPYNISGWEGSDYDTTGVAKRLGADVMLMRDYVNPETFQPVIFLIAQSNKSSSFHPPIVCYPALGYTIEEEATEEIFVHNASWASKPMYQALESKKEELGFFNGTLSVKKLIVTKQSSENVTDRRVVLYFYVKGGPFTSDTITMVRVSALAPPEGSYDGILNLTTKFMGNTIPYMFDLQREEPFVISILLESLIGKVVVCLLLLVPLVITFYPEIKRLRRL